MAGSGGQRVGGLYVSVSGDTGDLDRSLRRARDSMERTENSAKSLSSTLHGLEGAFEVAATAAAGLAIGLGLLVQRYAKVETQLSRIQATSGATAAQMDQMREVALKLGADMPTTMMQSTQALYELTTAGMSATEATEALAGVTYLAVAGQLRMAEAASATMTVLNAWSLEASKATAVADMLASVSAASATEVRGLADAFRYASATAAQLGVSGAELSAFVGVLSDMGLKASIAGTSINNALLSLIDPTAQAKEALRSVGLAMDDFYTESGKLKQVADIAALLRSSFEGMSDVEIQGVLTDVFGIRGARAISPLIQNVERYKNLLAEASQAQVAGGIQRLGDLSQPELETRRQEIGIEGFKLQPGSTRQVLSQFRQLAQQRGLTQQELAAKIQVGLDIAPDAARLLAGDLVSGTPMDSLVNGIESAKTSADLASATMSTFGGQIKQLTGALDTFFFHVYQGATGPLSLLLGILLPIGEFLAAHETLAKAFGVALVGLAAAAFLAAGALGAMYVEALLVESAIVGAMSSTYAYAASTSVMSAAMGFASSVAWLMTASLADLRAALLASRVAQLWTAASSITLSGALAVASTAMSTAAGAALSLWAALGPIGWIVLILIGLFAAWKSGLLDFIGLGSEADAVVASLMWVLGGLADVLDWLLGGLWSVSDGILGLLGLLLRIIALPIVIPIKALGVALRVLGDVVMGLTNPFDSLIGFITGLASSVDWLKVALLAIPGLGIAVWLFDLIGGFDLLSASVDALVGSVSGLAGWLWSLIRPFLEIAGIVDETTGKINWFMALLYTIPGAGLVVWLFQVADSFNVVSGAVDAAGAAFAWLVGGVQGLIDLLGGLYTAATNLSGALFSPLITALEIVRDTAEAAVGFIESALNKANQFVMTDWMVTSEKERKGKESGGGLVNGLVSGIKSGSKEVAQATRGVIDKAASYLPFSDAERGPLSQLTARGRALPQTFAKGAKQATSASREAGRSVAASASVGMTTVDYPSLTGMLSGLVGGAGRFFGGLFAPLIPGGQPSRTGPRGPPGPTSGDGVAGDDLTATQTDSGMTLEYSPTFNIDVGGGGLDDLGDLDERILELTRRAIADLERELETQLFRFETGQ